MSTLEIAKPDLGTAQDRYHAFLSYAHEDKATIEWLHRLLVGFWVPWKRRRRIFLDQDSLSAGGGLSERLKSALRDSKYLIVCCSNHYYDLLNVAGALIDAGLTDEGVAAITEAHVAAGKIEYEELRQRALTGSI